MGRSLLAGHTEAGVPHPALPAITDIPGSVQVTGAVTILVITETTQPRPRAQHPACPVVTNIIEVPGVTSVTSINDSLNSASSHLSCTPVSAWLMYTGLPC